MNVRKKIEKPCGILSCIQDLLVDNSDLLHIPLVGLSLPDLFYYYLRCCPQGLTTSCPYGPQTSNYTNQRLPFITHI